jgi:alkylated DNA nucleotide flippase Atl1
VFDDVRCHRLVTGTGTVAQTFTDELSERQKQLLRLLGISPSSYFSLPTTDNR